MVCSNCLETIKDTVTTRPDGDVWCYKCLKAEVRKPKSPKLARTKDPFVLLARKLRGVHRVCKYRHNLGEVIMISGSKRVYTNGYTLIGERDTTPETYRLVGLDHIWTLSKDEQFVYPDIEKVARNLRSISDMITIPEDFYQYAQAFFEPRPRHAKVRVKIRQGGIIIADSRDESEMVYEEFSAPLIAEADYDLRYFMVLKPREIVVNGERPAYVHSSYSPALKNCVVVLMMSMNPE